MSATETLSPAPSDLIAKAAAILGAENVLTSADELDFYSSDVFDQKKTAGMVLRPRTVEAVSQAVKLCTEADWAVVPRGGGMSYTGGYLTVRDNTAVIDMAQLTQIVEINAEDMYVIVEAGVTWRQLHEALKPLGLRTPYWGTVSGHYATIGGGLSQGAAHFGSAQYGISADSVLGLEVVIADGSVVRTGSWSSKYKPTPFFRNYGPDMTGLFLGDTGALGFKTRAALKLIQAPPHQRYATVAFETLEALMTSMAEVSRQGLASECGGWSPELAKKFATNNTDIQEDLKYLASIMKSGPSMLSGLKDAARIALAGRRDWKKEFFFLQVTIDDYSAAGADEKLKAVEAIRDKNGGRSINPSYPRAHRAIPFSDMRAGLSTGANERTVPSHGLCPHSRAIEMANAVYDHFESHAELMKQHKISFVLIMSEMYNNTTIVEPLINYEDPRGSHYSRAWTNGPPARTAPADEAQIEAVRHIRRGLMEMFMKNGCVHLQIGKSYPYKAGREPTTWALLEGIKKVVDPKGLINPGCLGLAAD